MILFREGSELVVITQSDHARFAAELLELWRRDGMPEHPRRAELLFAVREHDNGWWEADAAPRISPDSGRPRGFLEVSRGERMEIWRRGARRHRQPYPALLILEHALRLHAEHRGEPVWADFFTDLDGLREELVERSGLPEAEIRQGYQWLELADALSLLACGRRAPQIVRDGVLARSNGSALALEPFPLAGATTFAVPCRRVADRAYPGDAAFGLALAESRWERMQIRVVPVSEAIPTAR